MKNTHKLYIVLFIAMVLFAVLAISPVTAGGYAPIPYDPQEHQTAAEAQAIAGAAVDFRGTYGLYGGAAIERPSERPAVMPGPASDPTFYYYEPGPWNTYVAPIPGPWNP